MIPHRLKARLSKDWPLTSSTLRITADVVESLKTSAPHEGFLGYQALFKAYLSEGGRHDEAIQVCGPAARLAEALKKQGVSAKPIAEAAQEASP